MVWLWANTLLDGYNTGLITLFSPLISAIFLEWTAFLQMVTDINIYWYKFIRNHPYKTMPILNWYFWKANFCQPLYIDQNVSNRKKINFKFLKCDHFNSSKNYITVIIGRWANLPQNIYLESINKWHGHNYFIDLTEVPQLSTLVPVLTFLTVSVSYSVKFGQGRTC